LAWLVREPEAQVGRGEKIGDFVDGIVARRIVIGCWFSVKWSAGIPR